MERHPLRVIDCKGCGVCCTEIGVPPFLGFEIYELPESLRDKFLAELQEFPDREMAKTPCRWYDLISKRCLQHKYRPQLCRDFEVGSESCVAMRSHFNVE